MFGCSVFGVRVRDACSVFCSVFGLNACCVRSHVRLERLFVFVERCSGAALTKNASMLGVLREQIRRALGLDLASRPRRASSVEC